MDEAYEDCKLGEVSSQFDAPVDESHEGDGTTHSPLVKLDSDTEVTENSRTIGQLLDHIMVCLPASIDKLNHDCI